MRYITLRLLTRSLFKSGVADRRKTKNIEKKENVKKKVKKQCLRLAVLYTVFMCRVPFFMRLCIFTHV